MICCSDGWVLLNQEEGGYSRGPIGSTSLDYNQFNGVWGYLYVSPVMYVVITHDEDGELLRVCSSQDMLGANFNLMSTALAYIRHVLNVNVSTETGLNLITASIQERLRRM